MSIYKDCDIRGVYPQELTESETYKIGRALATLHPGEWLVGGDVRLSTPALKKALIGGLLASGADVADLGTIPTPALYFALRQYRTNRAVGTRMNFSSASLAETDGLLDVNRDFCKLEMAEKASRDAPPNLRGIDFKHSSAQSGATVTASHNPPDHNGVKFMSGALPVNRAEIDRVRECAQSGKFAEKSGSIRTLDALTEYKDFMSARFSAKRPLKVLIDAGCGAMGLAAPEVFRRAGYAVTELDCVPDGRFPSRSPNPSDFSNLRGTSQATKIADVDFCAAFDGDGDRAVFLTADGTPVQTEKIMAILIREALKNAPSSVVYDQKSSSVVRKAILEMGGTPLPERSGHAFIKRRFLENHSALAGEVSGHYFFRELGYDDGLFAALFLAEILARSDKTLKEMADEIVCPPVTPDLRIPCPYADQDACLARTEAAAADLGAEISRLDGVRADFPDGWLLLRKSVTCEQLTLRAEAENEARLSELTAFVRDLLPENSREYL